MQISTKLPEGFFDLTLEQQEHILEQRFKEVGKMDSYYRKLPAVNRGGKRVTEEVINERFIIKN